MNKVIWCQNKSKIQQKSRKIKLKYHSKENQEEKGVSERQSRKHGEVLFKKNCKEHSETERLKYPYEKNQAGT